MMNLVSQPQNMLNLIIGMSAVAVVFYYLPSFIYVPLIMLFIIMFYFMCNRQPTKLTTMFFNKEIKKPKNKSDEDDSDTEGDDDDDNVAEGDNKTSATSPSTTTTT